VPCGVNPALNEAAFFFAARYRRRTTWNLPVIASDGSQRDDPHLCSILLLELSGVSQWPWETVWAVRSTGASSFGPASDG
jgi:hypothetical protein